MLCVNLYAGARAVQLSQRLQRPWPNLPEALVLPPRARRRRSIAARRLAFALPELGRPHSPGSVRGALRCAYRRCRAWR